MFQSNLSVLNDLFNRIESSTGEFSETFVNEKERLILSMDLPIISFKKIIPKFERLTVNGSLPSRENKRIHEVGWLFPRDPESVKDYGRINRKKETIFYGSFLLPTLVNEVKPKVGDIVTVSTWILKDPKSHLLVFPTFDPEDYAPHFSSAQKIFFQHFTNYPILFRSFLIAQQNLFAKVFSKKFEFNSHYFLSASIASNIFNKVNSGQIEAIIYPSVQDTANINNIALKPNVVDKYLLSSIREYKIINNSEDLKIQQITGFAKVRNDKIVWE